MKDDKYQVVRKEFPHVYTDAKTALFNLLPLLMMSGMKHELIKHASVITYDCVEACVARNLAELSQCKHSEKTQWSDIMPLVVLTIK